MAVGEIGSLIDTLTWAISEATPPRARKRTPNILVVQAHRSVSAVVEWRSFSIDDAGNIGAGPIDSLYHGTNPARDPGMLQWYDDVFLSYINDNYAHGFLYTFACDDAGNIGAAIIDSLQVGDSANQIIRTELLQTSTSIVLTGPATGVTGHHLETIQVSTLGGIAAAVADTMDVTAQPKRIDMKPGPTTHVVLCYSPGANFYIETITVGSLGELPASVVDSWGAISSAHYVVDMESISAFVFVVLYHDTDNKLYLKTFSVNVDGSINKTWIDTVLVESALQNHINIKALGEGYFLLSYITTGPKWRFKTYKISAAGVIDGTPIDTFEPGFTSRGNQTWEHMGGDIWAMTYEHDVAWIGISTFDITSPSATAGGHELTMGIGP